MVEHLFCTQRAGGSNPSVSTNGEEIMEWISVKERPIPYDTEVLCIWKGRYGIAYKDSETKVLYCAICPYELSGIMKMDTECERRIKFYSLLPAQPDY